MKKKFILLTLTVLFFVQTNVLNAQDATIHFDINSAKIKEKQQSILNKINCNTNAVLFIIGEADGTGSEMYNFDLALRRAKAVEAYLTKRCPNVIASTVGETNAPNNVSNPDNRVAKLYLQSVNNSSIVSISKSKLISECDSVFYDDCEFICFKNGKETVYQNIAGNDNCLMFFDSTWYETVNPKQMIDSIRITQKDETFWQKIWDKIAFWKPDKTQKPQYAFIDTVYQIGFDVDLRVKRSFEADKDFVIAKMTWKNVFDNMGVEFVPDSIAEKIKEKSFLPYFINISETNVAEVNTLNVTIPKGIPFNKNDESNIILNRVNGNNVDSIYSPINDNNNDTSVYKFSINKPGCYYVDFNTAFSKTGRESAYYEKGSSLFVFVDSLSNAKIDTLSAKEIFNDKTINNFKTIKYALKNISDGKAKVTLLLNKNLTDISNYSLYYKYKDKKWIQDTVPININTTSYNKKEFWQLNFEVSDGEQFMIAKDEPQNQFTQLMVKKSFQLQVEKSNKLSSEILKMLIYDTQKQTFVKPIKYNGVFLIPKNITEANIYLTDGINSNILKLKDLKEKNGVHYLFYSDINKKNVDINNVDINNIKK